MSETKNKLNKCVSKTQTRHTGVGS